MISADTTLAKLLDEHPGLIETLVAYHDHFAHLRDVQVRGVMAARLTVAQAAAMAGVATGELVAALRLAAGEPACTDEPVVDTGSTRGPSARPAEIAGASPEAIVELDVRPDIRRGQEPFARIMAAVNALGTGQVLALHAPFEPVPLYDVLGRRGFAHWSENPEPSHWVMWFYRTPVNPDRTTQPSASPACPPPVVVDVRGLDPPEPMSRVLGALKRLEPGQPLEIVHDRRPMLLYPLLEEHGYEHTTDEREPGVVRIRVVRTPAVE